MPSLYLFTDSYPFGTGEPFLETEVRYLAEAFDVVRVIPRRSDSSPVPRPLPPGVELAPPLFNQSGRAYALRQALSGRPAGRAFFQEWRERRVGYSLNRWIKWLEAWCVVRRMLVHPDYPFAGREAGGSVLYFYWGVGSSWIIPFLPPGRDAVVRYHGSDLYEESKVHRGYMPFRPQQLLASRLAACVSEHGLKYLRDRYSAIPFFAEVHRLGVEDAGLPRYIPGPHFRIVTCSRMHPLKRLELLIEALGKLDFPICWTHIGDGPARESLRRRLNGLPKRITVNWTGRLSNRKVRSYYLESPQDLFVNVSEYEGVPVTIMEALNAGIPVLATDAGGTGELVDDEVGWLLPVGINAERLAASLKSARTQCGRDALRRAARLRWSERADAGKNYAAFGKVLQRLGRVCRQSGGKETRENLSAVGIGQG